MNTSLGANHLLENAHALNRLPPLALGVVGNQTSVESRRRGSGQYDRVDLVRLIPKLSKGDSDREDSRDRRVLIQGGERGSSPCQLHFGLILMRGW